jgi:hypothetical protein
MTTIAVAILVRLAGAIRWCPARSKRIAPESSSITMIDCALNSGTGTFSDAGASGEPRLRATAPTGAPAAFARSAFEVAAGVAVGSNSRPKAELPPPLLAPQAESRTAKAITPMSVRVLMCQQEYRALPFERTTVSNRQSTGSHRTQ